MGRARGAAMTRRGRLIERVERGGGQKRWAADRAGRERRRRNKEGRPTERGEGGGGERKRGGRRSGERGAAPEQKGAADGAGRVKRQRSKEGRTMGRGERSGGKRNRGGRSGWAKVTAPERGKDDVFRCCPRLHTATSSPAPNSAPFNSHQGPHPNSHHRVQMTSRGQNDSQRSN